MSNRGGGESTPACVIRPNVGTVTGIGKTITVTFVCQNKAVATVCDRRLAGTWQIHPAMALSPAIEAPEIKMSGRPGKARPRAPDLRFPLNLTSPSKKKFVRCALLFRVLDCVSIVALRCYNR